MIKFSDVEFAFPDGGFRLGPLSFSARIGERVCIIGRNGSGKSTLLRLAAGLLKPSAGTIQIDLPIVPIGTASDEIRPPIGFMFQNPQDHILTNQVESELAFELENLCLKRPEMLRRVSASAVNFGLDKILERSPAELAAGEEQRVAIASTLIAEPRLLVLDEPASFLDSLGREILIEKVLNRTESCVLVATHQLSLLKNFDRVIFLDGGRITFDGNVEEFTNSDTVKIIQSRNLRELQPVARLEQSRMGSDVRLNSVSYRHRSEEPCIENLSLTIPDAAITWISGNSGSGKSTLAMLIAGLLKEHTGEMKLAGQVTTESDRIRNVGYIFQIPETSIFAETVLDEIAFGLINAGKSKEYAEPIVRDTLELLGLGPDTYLGRNPHSLSSGERRLIAIASILALDRPVIIFDESTASLDWEAEGILMRLMLALKASGKTVIVIGHDSTFLDMIADNKICMPLS